MPVEVSCQDEPPLTRAEAGAARAARMFLYFLGFAPIALFPLGVAYKIYEHLFS